MVRQQVLARAALADAGYGLEAEARPPVEGLVEAARHGRGARPPGRRAEAARRRCCAAARRPGEPARPGLRQRLDATIRGLDRRADQQLGAWASCCAISASRRSAESVEWLALDRFDGNEIDVAVIRNWVDPGIPFAEQVAQPAHGLVVTSATLTDGDADPDAGLARRRSRERPAPSGGAPGRRADRLALRLSGADPHPRRHRHSARRHRPGGGGLCRAVRCRGRRRARPLHRDQPAAHRA